MPNVHAHRATKDAMASLTKDELKLRFITQARNNCLSPETMMLTSYLLFGTPEQQLYIAAIFLEKSGHDLIMAHNIFVAEQLDKYFMLSYGKVIAASEDGRIGPPLRLPLFPPIPEMLPLNVHLINEAAAVAGGSDTLPPFPKVFQPTRPIGGECFLPVTDTPYGPAVDFTVPEQDFTGMQRQLNRLENRVNGISNTRRFRGRGGRGYFRGGRGNSYARGGSGGSGDEADKAHTSAPPPTPETSRNRRSGF